MQTDKCPYGEDGRPAPGTQSELCVKDNGGTGELVGSVDAVAWDSRNGQEVAVDVKFSGKYEKRGGPAAPRFDYLRCGKGVLMRCPCKDSSLGFGSCVTRADFHSPC